ncbi:MAG: hypothetical protein ABIS47_07450, partial [Acidimicrobiales bacterium]
MAIGPRWRRRPIDRRLVLVLVVVAALLGTGLTVRLLGARRGDVLVGTVKDPRTSRPVSIADATVGGASSGAGVAIPEPPGAAPGGGAGALDDGP